ncbi:MAG: hypothetical protein DMF64_19235 [Acidobacteria bacterium]|nr:MAG: hypothetical protein DMF64_19235 [Acidobacteriota bacterium]
MPENTTTEQNWLVCDWLAALCLFLATAAVVGWQNSRLGVLWDASYILENSYRISLGDIPYRDFPFPYAPLTFLTQAAIIKTAGRVFWHHIVYCALVGGLTTVLTWRILLRLLRGAVPRVRLVAFCLSAPLVVLGIYSIFPHPFYDPDCTFVIVICLMLLLRLERKGFPQLLACLTGVVLVGPLFVKQNTGLAFLLSIVLALIGLLVIEAWRKQPIRGYVWLLVGIVLGLAAALLLIQCTAGLNNYVRWTIQFAAARRTPPLADMLAIYQNRLMMLWLAAFVGGVILWRFNRRGSRALASLAACLLSLPFVWAVIYLFIDKDASEQAERLVDVWPFVLVVAFLCALLSLRRRMGFTQVLPFILIATAHGAFLSQQLWGSTYGLWPLLTLLLATAITNFYALTGKKQAGNSASWTVVMFASVVAASLLIAGGSYVWAHERLDYANLSDGELAHSKQSALNGLSMRGSWLPDFDELVSYADKEIPPADGILMLPGEDLFYYTTGRHPRFPVLMFDHTVNPYSPEEVVALAQAKDIRWLIVKQDLQLEDDQVAQERDEMLKPLEQDFEQVESLNNYDIYRRKMGNDNEDDKDDQNSDNSSQIEQETH